jgi:hypothetical protein
MGYTCLTAGGGFRDFTTVDESYFTTAEKNIFKIADALFRISSMTTLTPGGNGPERPSRCALRLTNHQGRRLFD